MANPNIIVLDLETKKAFDEVGGPGNVAALGVSVVGVYSYIHEEYQAYWESDFPRLLAVLAQKPLVVGFNHRRFDLPVLQPYFRNFDLQQLALVDILEELTKTLGHRVKLDSVAQATLGTGKSASGLDAIRYWNTGDLESLKKYCLDDVRITKEIFEYGAKHGEVLFMDRSGLTKKKAPVNWKMAQEEKKEEEKQFNLF